MKKTLSFLFLLIAIISIPAVSLAALKTVTIDWTIADTTGVLGYKLYHSYNSDMGDKMLACETNDTTATSLTCANVPIDNYPVYFTIAAVTADSEINSQVDQYIYTVKVVQNFIVTTPGGTITPPEPPQLNHLLKGLQKASFFFTIFVPVLETPSTTFQI